MPAAHLMLAQAKQKTEREDPLLSNRFVASDGVESAVGALITLTECNADRDPKFPIFPIPDESRTTLFKHVDQSEELHHLLDSEDYEEAYFEVGQICLHCCHHSAKKSLHC